MTKSDELVKLLAEVDDHCTNTFCNTCPYQQMSGEYPCSFYAIAQKLIDEGYDKKKTVVEEFAKKLKKRSYCDNDFMDGKWHRYVFVDEIDELLKEYENE